MHCGSVLPERIWQFQSSVPAGPIPLLPPLTAGGRAELCPGVPRQVSSSFCAVAAVSCSFSTSDPAGKVY